MARNHLARDLTALMLLKVLALVLLYAFCFGPSHRRPAEPSLLFGTVPPVAASSNPR